MNILVLNPGGNSLKAEVIGFDQKQSHAFMGTKLLSVGIDGIGRDQTFTQYKGKKAVSNEPIAARDYEQAAESFLHWYENHSDANLPSWKQIDAVAVRVVHGGPDFVQPIVIDSAVERRITELEKLAPLHNNSSIEVLKPLRDKFPGTLIFGVFDTAFHRTIPDYASLYAIPRDLADRHQIRRYGFHGISHRYLVERYAYLVGKPSEECNIVATHLESGCSVTAIARGKAVDNTMGLTPLEGLMMGTRSGDVDPSIIPLLMHEENMSVDSVMELLNKQSGLLGISEVSLDTRVLMRQYDKNPHVKLALDMFAYRVRKAVGAHLTVLGDADAIVFGGGIAENSSFVRRCVCEGLRGFGVEIDAEANTTLIDIEGKLSKTESRIEVWVIPTEEGLQIAHECCQSFQK